MRRLADEQSGAVAVYIAILLTVLIGMAAFIVDMGDVMWERRMLQNSADAAALAVAIDCSQGDCGDFADTADTFADANNRRGAFVESITGPNGGALTPEGGQVTVVTRTGSTEGAGRLPQFFSGILGQTQGLQTGARATAIWGVPNLVAEASNLTVSICNFESLTGLDWNDGQPDLMQLPDIAGAANLVAGGNVGGTIYYQDAQGKFVDDTCKGPPMFYTDPADAEDDLPATFGWLQSDGCTVEVTTDSDGDWVDAKPGGAAGGETACIKDLVDQDPPVAVLPVFVGIREDNNGTPQEYRVVAPAGFYFTGYRLAGAGGPISYPQGAPPCKGQERCIRGHFVRMSIDSEVVDDVSFGLTSVRLFE